MSLGTWGLNNIFINNYIPMPADPFGGLNPFCSGFGYPMTPFDFMSPQFNIFSSFQPFMMPNIATMPSIFSGGFSSMPFSMNTSIFSMPFLSNPFDFVLPSSVYTGGLPGLNIPAFGGLTSHANNSASDSDSNFTHNIDSGFNNSQKLDKKFLNKVKQVAKKLNCNYKDLLAVMNSESGLRTNNWNGSTAVGLIQFTDSAIAELNKRYKLNLTKAKIAKMTPIQQLDLTEKLLMLSKKYAFAPNARLSAADLYAITFLPGRANKEVLCVRGENFYTQNKGLDKNNDGKITKSDLSRHLKNKYVNESLFA